MPIAIIAHRTWSSGFGAVQLHETIETRAVIERAKGAQRTSTWSRSMTRSGKQVPIDQRCVGCGTIMVAQPV